MKRADVLAVKVFSPFKTHYHGPAVSVTAANKTGRFDVLLDHANFFSVLEPGEVVVDTGKRTLSFKIGRSVIKVADNHVSLFAGV